MKPTETSIRRILYDVIEAAEHLEGWRRREDAEPLARRLREYVVQLMSSLENDDERRDVADWLARRGSK